MTDFLEDLVRAAQRTVASGYYCVNGEPVRGPGLTGALRVGPTFPVIAEVKLASPSRGRVSSRPPQELIDLYLAGGAAALSVLTEPGRFLGSMDTLRRAASTGAPVLMKDFIVSERQLRAAAVAGAGSVLLIQEAFEFLPRERRDQLIAFAHESNLEVVLEAGCEAALIEAMGSEADVLGINQRDLRTFEVDRSKSSRLLPVARSDTRPVVVLSGLEDRRDIVEVRDQGASGALIGTALASSDDPASLLRQLEMTR